jgi:hypothetical protein
LWIVIEGWRIGELHAHVMALQLLQHQHLVGIDTGQTVRRQAED